MALLATLPGMPVVAAQTLDEAVAAYERGDYATAIRGFRKAAEQGKRQQPVSTSVTRTPKAGARPRTTKRL